MNTPRASKRGQSMVEFAFILPLLLLVMVMLFDVGRAVYYYSVIHNAAREGARYGTINNEMGTGCITPRAGLDAHVRQLTVGLNAADLSVTPVCVGSKIRVTVTYSFEPVTPLAKSFITGGKITLKSISAMNVEG